jgi:hypothetical protein
MSILKGILESEVANWEFVGHAALLHRFVLRNGKAYTPTKRIGRKMEMKQCFANSYKTVLRKTDWSYVEGFTIHRERPLMAIHHAWVTTNGNDAMDPTLNAAEYDYFGIAFDRMTMIEETARNRFYGILDTGLGMNVRLMFGLDPELRSIVEAVKPHSAWQKAQAETTAFKVIQGDLT